MFGELLPVLAKGRQVIAVDLQAHGRTADIGRPMSYEQMGDADMIPPAHAAAFFALLGGGKADGGWDGSGMSNARLAILPGMTHYHIFSSPTLVSAVMPFLDAPMPKSSRITEGRG